MPVNFGLFGLKNANRIDDNNNNMEKRAISLNFDTIVDTFFFFSDRRANGFDLIRSMQCNQATELAESINFEIPFDEVVHFVRVEIDYFSLEIFIVVRP